MKKLFALFLTVCLVLSALCLPAAAEETWVEVSTWGELYNAVTSNPAANIKLTGDISINDEDSALKDLETVGIFTNRSVLGAIESYSYENGTDKGTALSFTGTLDGNGHTIDFENKLIDFVGYDGQPSKTGNTGGILFYNFGGTVKNLTMTGINMVSRPTSGSQNGIITANANGNYTVENVHITATFSKTQNETTTSKNTNFGMIGRQASAVEGSITNCSVNIVATGDHASDCWGAFVGSVSKGSLTVRNCVASGSITTPGNAAGVVGSYKSTGALTVENFVNLATLNGEAASNTVANVADGAGTFTATNCTDFSGTNAFDVLSGARLRLASGENAEKNSGIRFDIATSADLITALTGLGCTVKLGSLVWATDAEASYAFTAEAMSAAGKKYSEKSTAVADTNLRENNSENEAYYGYTAALINITEFAQAYSCRAFIDLVFEGGITVRLYSDYAAADNSRSLQTLATRALGDDTVDYSAYEELLKTFAGIQ